MLANTLDRFTSTAKSASRGDGADTACFDMEYQLEKLSPAGSWVRITPASMKHLSLRPLCVGGSTTFDVLLGPADGDGEVIPMASITRVFTGFITFGKITLETKELRVLLTGKKPEADRLVKLLRAVKNPKSALTHEGFECCHPCRHRRPAAKDLVSPTLKRKLETQTESTRRQVTARGVCDASEQQQQQQHQRGEAHAQRRTEMQEDALCKLAEERTKLEAIRAQIDGEKQAIALERQQLETDKRALSDLRRQNREELERTNADARELKRQQAALEEARKATATLRAEREACDEELRRMRADNDTLRQTLLDDEAVLLTRQAEVARAREQATAAEVAANMARREAELAQADTLVQQVRLDEQRAQLERQQREVQAAVAAGQAALAAAREVELAAARRQAEATASFTAAAAASATTSGRRADPPAGPAAVHIKTCPCNPCKERRQTEAAAKKAAAQRKREADAEQKATAKKQAEVERARAAEMERARQAAEASRKQTEQERIRENIERNKAEQKRRFEAEQKRWFEAQKENQRPHFTSAADVKPSDANMPGWFQQHAKRQGEKERYDAFLQQMESLKSAAPGTLKYSDFPFPNLAVDNAAFIFPVDDAAVRKAKIRAATLRWHPDKFCTTFQPLCRPAAWAAVSETATRLSEAALAMRRQE